MSSTIPNENFDDCAELLGKPYPISDIAIALYKIQSMLRHFESKVVLLTLIEFLYSKSIKLDFSEDGRHKMFEPDLISNKILSFNGESFEIDPVFAATLCEIEIQNNLHQRLRDSIFQRTKFESKIAITLKFYNSSKKAQEQPTQELDTNLADNIADGSFDYTLKIFKFLKTL